MEKNNQNQHQTNLERLDNYMAVVSPIGDWRNPALDTPLMTRFVSNFYNPRSSQANKLAFYRDILESFTNPDKQRTVGNERMNNIPYQVQDVVKDLVNDTINIRSQNTFSFLNENLRREFVQAEYMATGTNLGNSQASERELSSVGITPEGIVQILSNLTSLELYSSALDGIAKDILPELVPLATMLKNTNPKQYQIVRELVAAAEGLGVLLSVLKGLHDGAMTIQPANLSSNLAVQGLGINTDVVGHAPERSFQDIQADINNIAKTMAPFGQQAPARVTQVLQNCGNDNDIQDIKNIITNGIMKIRNPEKHALGVSTLFAINNAPEILTKAPKNIAAAMMYISKLYADKVNVGGNAQTASIAKGFTAITDLPLQVVDNYRYSLPQAILYDMVTGNGHGTTSLGMLMRTPELCNFARMMLSKEISGHPQLTKQALISHVKTASAFNTTPSANDVDEFMKSRHYICNASPAMKQELVAAILKACESIK